MPVDSNILRETVKYYYEKLNKDQDVGAFSASKGWLDRFKRREKLQHFKNTGEKASADHVTV